MRLIYGKTDEICSDESALGRSLLMEVLRNEGISATAEDVVKDSLGKPYLSDRMGVEFNITHKSGFVACILSVGEGRVGIDAEPSEGALRVSHVERFSKKYFSENEIDALKLKIRGFSEIWTRKEAYLKMLGCGIGKEISKFDTEDAESVCFKTFYIDGFTVTVAAEQEAEISLTERKIG